MNRLIVQNKYIWLLLAVSISSFFLTLVYAPIYDYADMTVPKRYFIMECLHNGILPLWNPYQSMGSPEHIDTNLFYLPLYLLSLFGRYNSVIWGVEEIFYAFVAGAGFFKLSKYFGVKEKAAFVISVCYMNSGVFIANTQHFTWIIGLAWLPFVLLYFIGLIEKPRKRNVILFSVFATLLFTGAYPGFVFVLLSFFIVILAFHIIGNRLWKEKRYLFSLIKCIALSALLCIVLSLPYLISIYQATDFVVRGTPVAYEKTTAVPFTWTGFSSLLFPYIACTEGSFTGTDISMGSIFIGVITLFFCGLGIRKINNYSLKAIVIWGVLCGLVSLGDALPVHRWAFSVFPFFNYIRIVAFFRIFLMLTLLVLAVAGFDRYLKERAKLRKPFYFFLLSVAGIYLATLMFFAIKTPQTIHNLCSFNFNALLHTTIENKFVAVSFFELLLLICAVFALRMKKHSVKALVFILCFELITVSWLCLPYTGINTKGSNTELSIQIAALPKGFPLPDTTTDQVIISHKYNINLLWRNLGMLVKEVEYDSYNPFSLSTHKQMLKPYEDEEKSLLLPVVFFPKVIIYSDTAMFFSADTSYSNNISLVQEHTDANSQMRLRVFKPGSIIIESKSDEERPLVVAQNYYPGWKAKINGEQTAITTVNTSLICISLPKGECKVELSYSRPDLVATMIAAAAGWIAVFVCLLLTVFHKRRRDSNQ